MLCAKPGCSGTVLQQQVVTVTVTGGHGVFILATSSWLTCTGCFVLDVHAKHVCLKHKVCGHVRVCQIECLVIRGLACIAQSCLFSCVALHLRLYFPRTQNNPILSFEVCLCHISCTAFCLRLYLCYRCLYSCVPCNRVACVFALVCIKVLPESYVSLVVMYAQRGPPKAKIVPLRIQRMETHRMYLCGCVFVGQNACLIVNVIVIVFCCCLTTSL